MTDADAPWHANLPTMPELDTVADGGADGRRWWIRAGGTRDGYLTLLDVELPDGRRTGGGGHGGPALLPGHVMSVSLHRSDAPVQYLVGRLHPSVARVRVDMTAPAHGGAVDTLDAPPVGRDPRVDVAFVAVILPSESDVVGVSAWDANDHLLQDRQLPGGRLSWQPERSTERGSDGQPDHHIDDGDT